jgi:hypothetical protein
MAGDQIVRIFAQWILFTLGSDMKIAEGTHFGLLYSTVTFMHRFRKNGLGNNLGEFWQSHLVTLMTSYNADRQDFIVRVNRPLLNC